MRCVRPRRPGWREGGYAAWREAACSGLEGRFASFARRQPFPAVLRTILQPTWSLDGRDRRWVRAENTRLMLWEQTMGMRAWHSTLGGAKGRKGRKRPTGQGQKDAPNPSRAKFAQNFAGNFAGKGFVSSLRDGPYPGGEMVHIPADG